MTLKDWQCRYKNYPANDLICPLKQLLGCRVSNGPAFFIFFIVCAFQVVSAPRGCTRDEGRSLEASLQERASNHLKLLRLKALVVSVKEKAGQ